MSSRLEQTVSVAISLAAGVLALVAVRREIFPVSQTASIAASPTTIDSVSRWESAIPLSLSIGLDSGRATLLVASDIECPACRAFHRSLQRHLESGSFPIRVHYLHFPLRQHRFAIPAAALVECASRQGRTETALDVLFEKQDSLGLKSWTSYARDVGLGQPDAVGACMSSGEILARVDAARESGELLGVRFTPTVIVNCWRISQVPSHAQLGDLLALAVAGRKPQLNAPLGSEPSSPAGGGGNP